MKKIFYGISKLIIIGIWILGCYRLLEIVGKENILWFWMLAGFPFGYQRMKVILIPKGFGISGEVGVFALNVIFAGLLGGVFLTKTITKIICDLIMSVFHLWKLQTIKMC